MTRAPSDQRPAIRSRVNSVLLWGAPLLALIAWVIHRLDVLPTSVQVRVNGESVSVDRALFTVDHPFHTARADLIAQAWQAFDTVRWVGSHQGGYPAEFFPFGVPGMAALLSIVSLDTLSIETAWSFTVAILFLLPLVGFALLAWADRVSPAVVVVSLAAHVAIASDWMHGGYTELVEWGLATNVAGATYALIALPLLVRAASEVTIRWIVPAAVVIALCAVSNPRSLIAVAVMAAVVFALEAVRGRWRAAAIRVGSVAALSIGLSAPVIVPLLRYNAHYFFLSYQEYGSVPEYAHASIDAASWPVLVFAGLGVVLTFVRSGYRANQAAAATLVAYIALTATTVALPGLRELVPQLELPRLMPFQRLLTVYVAAYGVVRLVGLVPLPRPQLRDVGAALIVSAALLVAYTTSVGVLPAEERGLREVPRTEGANGEELVTFPAAVEEAASSSRPDAAILVLGSRLNWHEQLWAPMVVPDRRFLYNDWLWYWHTEHDGPYDYRNGHFYPNPSETLDRAYLDTHGVGAVIVTDIADATSGANARNAARASSNLESIATVGSWDVYRVAEPAGIATLDGAEPTAVSVGSDFERISIEFDDAEAGTLLVRQNWFPRWAATVNGEEWPVERGASGYMTVALESGPQEIELIYALTTTDAIARVAAMASAMIAAVVLLFATPISRLARR